MCIDSEHHIQGAQKNPQTLMYKSLTYLTLFARIF